MSTSPGPAPGATTATSQSVAVAPIPFRKTAAASGPEVFGVLVTTLLLLAIFAALAVFARRRGWLDRWVGAAPSKSELKKKLAVTETLRISRKTTVYRVSDGDREFLLAESSAPLQLSPVVLVAEQLP
jgi:hypothetical protein